MGEPLVAADSDASASLLEPAPFLVPAKQAAKLCGISVASWHRKNAAGQIGPRAVRIGGCVRWRTEELRRWAEAGCPDRHTWDAMNTIEPASLNRRGH